MSQFYLVFRVHAIRRMFQRRISEEDVKQVATTGEMIETYPTNKPFPSRPILGWSGARPIHVVAADNAQAQETIIVTVYQPNDAEWEAGFKRRKPQ